MANNNDKVTVDRMKLIEALDLVAQAADKDAAVAITVKDGWFTLTVLFANGHARAAVETSSTANWTDMVPLKPLSECMRAGASEMAEFTPDDWLRVQVGRTKHSFKPRAGKMPDISIEEPVIRFNLTVGIMRAISERVGRFAADEFGSPTSYVLLKDSVVYGTDGRRLARLTVPEACGDYEILVPTVVFAMTGHLSDEQVVTVEIGTSRVFFRSLDYEWSGLLANNKIPDTYRIMPGNIRSAVLVDRTVFENALREVSVIKGAVHLKSEGGRLTLLVVDDVRGREGESALETDEQSGEPFTATSDVRHLLEALNALGGGQLRLATSDLASPVLLTTVGDNRYSHILMQIKE